MRHPDLPSTCSYSIKWASFCPHSYSSFKGMAIRIEDDVLLTDGGNEVLSACSPKKVEEIEALVGTDPLS